MNLCRQLHEAYKGKSIIGHLITILTILQGWGKMKRAIIIFNGGTLYPTDKKSICYGKNKLIKPVSNPAAREILWTGLEEWLAGQRWYAAVWRPSTCCFSPPLCIVCIAPAESLVPFFSYPSAATASLPDSFHGWHPEPVVNENWTVEPVFTLTTCWGQILHISGR